MKLKRENKSNPRHHQMFLISAVLCILGNLECSPDACV
jgi:hypothetical protein